ncbi:MAG: methyl-accepting chemotaxis protein [Methylovirgula sp.]|uniref:methyl-accepting chemotaxis protein n=1 Tax=Methylovirgula sp. TaxID=1978224 RepID=UPI0030765B9F
MLGFEIDTSDRKGVLEALSRSLAIIEFDPDGKVLTANQNFCDLLGYTLAEIQARHHSMFVDPAFSQSQAYRDFWKKLASGKFDVAEYKRIGKGGKEVWIQASYNPVVDRRGTVTKVVKVATDITAEKLKNAEFAGKLNAISRAQGVIEFTTDGEIITANQNFLTTLGYTLEEIQGKHHRIFVDAEYAQSAEYRDFWRRLQSGEFIAAEFKRIGKGKKEVWIQASYNPIFDMNNRVVKVVKFATDVTERVVAVKEIGAGLARLADQDLTYEIAREFNPSFENLRLDFNRSVENLRNALVQIARGTDSISSGTRSITTASDDLSQRTERQAASLEETAAALDEITAVVKKSATEAIHARQVAAEADDDAKKGTIVVRQAVEAMNAIAKSAQQISQIIGVIDEIAFQTNLLALNAGVEAARAGDAGRGFAVVASEVRALAQRSAEAAKEIKSLISSSSAEVENGVALVAETGKSLERILAQVVDINGIIGNIASGAQEQSAGLQQVNTAVNDMDRVTQQNAAMVEETTAASHALAEDTAQVEALIAQFRIETGKENAPVPYEPRKSTAPVRQPEKMARVSNARPAKQAGRGSLKAVVGGGTVSSDWEEF